MAASVNPLFISSESSRIQRQAITVNPQPEPSSVRAMAKTINSIYSYDVVLAHGPGCNDGATSAWAIWRSLPVEYRDTLAAEGGFYAAPSYDDESTDVGAQNDPFIHPNSPEGAMNLQDRGFPVVFVFVQPSEGVPNRLVAGKRVMVLDLDMGDAIVPLVRSATFVLLADHHDSTPKTIHKHSQLLLDECRHKFSMFVSTNKQECGATLSWRLSHTAAIPPLVQVVRIGDTWQWDDYPELQARYVLKALYMRRAFRSFADIEEVYQTWDQQFNTYVSQGRSVLDYEKSLVRQAAKQCDLGFIQTNDGTVYTVAYTQASILHSEIGSAMKWYASKRFRIPIHFCVSWKYASFKSLVSVSLRDPDPGINLAHIARNIKGGDGKGGGHAEAAGFSFYGIENFHKFVLKSVPVEVSTLNIRSIEPVDQSALRHLPESDWISVSEAPDRLPTSDDDSDRPKLTTSTQVKQPAVIPNVDGN